VRFYHAAYRRRASALATAASRSPAAYQRTITRGMSPAKRLIIMASTEAKAGFGIAWLLGIPLPILAIVYLVSRC
jgi:hypothetical protein